MRAIRLKQVFLALVTLTAFNAVAGEDLLITAKTPDGSISTPIYVITDANGDLAGLRISKNKYNAAQIRDGVDLNVKGHSGILTVYASEVDLKRGGRLRLNYNTDKANIFAKNKNFYADVHRGDDGKWHLYNGSKIVNTLAITPASRGISAISPVAILAGNPDKFLNDLEPAKPEAMPKVEEAAIAKLISEPVSGSQIADEVDGGKPATATPAG